MEDQTRVGAVAVIAGDAYGRAVCDEASAMVGASALGSILRPSGDPALIAFVSARPILSSARESARSARRAGIAWTPVWWIDAALVVGPVQDPSAGPCIDCFLARTLQHEADPMAHEALAKRWELPNPGLSFGVFRPAVRLTILELVRIGAALRDGRCAPGSIARLAVPVASVERGRLTSVHGCACASGPGSEGRMEVSA